MTTTRRRSAFLCLLLLTAALAAPVPASAAAKACFAGCRRAKAACVREARTARVAAITACVAEGTGRPACRRAAKSGARRAQASCASTLRDVCLPCCRGGGSECAASDGGAGSGASCSGADCPVADVTYTPETVVLAPDTVARTFRGVNEDGTVFRFDPTADQVRNLLPGTVLLVHGKALRKVVAVHDEGDALAVETEDAALTDLIEDGEISWDSPLDLTQGVVRVDPGADAAPSAPEPPQAGGPAAFRTLAADAPPAIKYSGTLDKEYEYEMTFTPTPGRMGIDVLIKKSASSPLLVNLHGKGFVETTGTRGAIRIAARSTESFEFDASSLRGELRLTWEAGSKIPGANAENLVLRLPVKYDIPFVIEGIPFFLRFAAAFSITPAFTSKDATSVASFTVTYEGSEGFSFANNTLTGTGSMSSTPAIDENASNIFGLGVQGFTAAMQFPRIALGIGLLGKAETSGYVDIVTSGLTLTPGELGFKHCQKYALYVSGKAGLDFKLLGLSLPIASHEIFKTDVSATFPAGVSCDP